MIQNGVIIQLEIIGEASKIISQETREKFSNIPRKDMAGMRDKLIHDYLGVDVEQVWFTAKNDLPDLQSELVRVLDSLL